MTGRGKVPLQVHGVPSEGSARAIRAGADCFHELPLVVRHLHADSAAAARGLDEQRKPDDARFVDRQLGRHVPFRTRDDRNSRIAHHRARLRLVLDRAHRAGRRADEHQSGGRARLREIRLLGEEAVPRVNRLRAGALRGIDHFLRVQVALPSRRRTEPHRLIALLDVKRALVRVRVDRDRAHAQRASSTRHAAGDLAAVGDEQLVEHVARLHRSAEKARSILQQKQHRSR